MIQRKEDYLQDFKKIISEEKEIIKEIGTLSENFENAVRSEDKEMISSQLKLLKYSLIEKNEKIPELLEKINLVKPLPTEKIPELKSSEMKSAKKLREKLQPKKIEEKPGLSEIEKSILKRLKKKEIEAREEIHKQPSIYVRTANKFFSDYSKALIKKSPFSAVRENLIKTNLRFTPASYISVIFLTTLIAILFGVFAFIFSLFFNFPSMTLVTENIGVRVVKVFWVLFIFPMATFMFMYFYPALERKSLGDKINQELPFATIHMAAISGSMLDPSKIFEIMITTKEYPNIEKEFVKLMNEINTYGSDLVNALKRVALNCPSQKLVDLFNGLATTITSGGDLPRFFNKRAETLLLEYRLEREKYTKSAETFMDIYISVVIAAPMILMLLLIMMKVSGFGISLSTTAITLIMVLGVSTINVVFLTFLKLKQPST
jgi:hypothetical protein